MCTRLELYTLKAIYDTTIQCLLWMIAPSVVYIYRTMGDGYIYRVTLAVVRTPEGTAERWLHRSHPLRTETP